MLCEPVDEIVNFKSGPCEVSTPDTLCCDGKSHLKQIFGLPEYYWRDSCCGETAYSRIVFRTAWPLVTPCVTFVTLWPLWPSLWDMLPKSFKALCWFAAMVNLVWDVQILNVAVPRRLTLKLTNAVVIQSFPKLSDATMNTQNFCFPF